MVPILIHKFTLFGIILCYIGGILQIINYLLSTSELNYEQILEMCILYSYITAYAVVTKEPLSY